MAKQDHPVSKSLRFASQSPDEAQSELAQELSQNSTVTRRSLEDQERDKAVYEYLLRCLTDLGLEKAKSKPKSNEKPKPNESLIALQWGQKDNRIFVRRVLRSVLPEHYQDEKNADQKLPGLTLGKLVEILESLQEYWSKKDPASFKGQVPRIISRAEKLKALCKFFQLSREERDRLGLPLRPGDALMQQLVESLSDPVRGLSNDELVEFYQTALNLYQSLRNRDPRLTNASNSSLRSLIEKEIKQLVSEYFDKRPTQDHKQEFIENLRRKVEREINRISFQCGFRHVESLLSTKQNSIEITKRYLPRSFIAHLTRSVFENEILTDEFPVHVDHYTVEKIRPLPLEVKTPHNDFGLLNLDLLDEGENQEDINGLERQFIYKVTVHFYVKLPENYRPKFNNPNIEDEFSEGRLHFSEEVRGIGSLISLITAAINSVLLYDIPVLQGYAPIAKEVLRINEIIGQSGYSPVWSNVLVKLCKEKDIATAIEQKQPYEDVTQDYELSYGEFCGFDLLEVTAKAALIARLRAIKQAGINANEYITQLCDRVREAAALKQAHSYFRLYPFSLRVMEAYLDQTIFAAHRYRTRTRQFEFTEKQPEARWSSVAYDAHILLARVYLMEGLYRVGKRYLDVLKPHVEKGYLSDLLLAKYELCRFRYYYLADLKDQDFAELGRYPAVQKAWEALDNAENHLKHRLKKYYKLNEFSQSNFHPFFSLLCRIYSHRAKLHIFASSYTPRHGGQDWNPLLEPIRLLEKARIYAAQDGDPLEYSYWSSYQGWAYLILAYLRENNRVLPNTNFRECIDWARRLVEDALLCYSSFGQQCYQAIKDNGGKVTPHLKGTKHNPKYYDQYGQLQIQVLPFIEELNQHGESEAEQEYDSRKRILRVDLSILKTTQKTRLGVKNQIYLFGTHSAILLFASGMLELCEEQQNVTQLRDNIRKAERLFTYCWATAQDGAVPSTQGDMTILDRKLQLGAKEEKDSLIQGLYPHRITQFADLGKVFAAVCKVLLWLETLENTEEQWEKIEQLLNALHTGIDQGATISLHQNRYNGHLSSHFEKIRGYFRKLKENPLQNDTIIKYRDRVVREMFRYILRQNE